VEFLARASAVLGSSLHHAETLRGRAPRWPGRGAERGRGTRHGVHRHPAGRGGRRRHRREL